MQLCAVSSHCTSFFSHGVSSTAREDGKFISESCEVFAFGSNSSSQLAMGSTEKFHKATLMSHMANVQVVGTCTCTKILRLQGIHADIILCHCVGVTGATTGACYEYLFYHAPIQIHYN